ncbi:MAG: hypothetical protein ACRDRS_06400 [Pseudonocardiaceae bacterium]
MTLVVRGDPWVYPRSYTFLCTMLRGVLSEGLHAGLGTEEGLGSPRCRFSGALYALLLEHPIDQRGCCRTCPGGVFGLRARRCAVHLQVGYWLRQPDWLLYSRVADEWRVAPQPPLVGAAPESAARPANPADAGHRPRDQAGEARFAQSANADPDHPAPPPRRPPGTGWSAPHHGAAGDDPNGLWPRPVPPGNSPRHSAELPQRTGDIT